LEENIVCVEMLANIRQPNLQDRRSHYKIGDRT